MKELMLLLWEWTDYYRSDKDNEFAQCPSGFLCAYTSYYLVTAQQKGPCEMMAPHPQTCQPPCLWTKYTSVISTHWYYTADSTLQHRIDQMSVKEDELELWVIGRMNESDYRC